MGNLYVKPLREKRAPMYAEVHEEWFQLDDVGEDDLDDDLDDVGEDEQDDPGDK